MALQPNTNGDGASIAPLEEGVATLRWSPTSNFLTATCWDGNAYIWDVKSHNVAEPKLCQNLGAPALCASWAHDGARLFFGGCSPNARIWDLASNTVSPIGKHDDTIRHMVALPNMLVTASWDKSVRYWDVRAPSTTPMGGVMTGDKVFVMDALGNLCVVGTASRRIIIYDLRKPTVEYKSHESPLKYQLRSIACFSDMTGYAAGSIEGRVAIQYIEEHSKNFVFKCHRAGQNSREVYAVNDIHFNQLGTFATVGSDGTCNFWDKEQRSRLKAFNRCSDTISCCRFSATSQYFAYAVSYDWSMGAQGYNATKKNHILIHEVLEKEVKPKPKPK